MLSSKTKSKNSLGSIIVTYLNRLSENTNSKAKIEKETAYYFDLLSKYVVTLLKKVIRSNNITKVVTDEQIELSKADLLRQITTEPAKYESLIEKIHSETEQNTPKKTKQLSELQAELHVSSKIREMFLLEEKPALSINSYLYKVALTSLKRNAEDVSKEYILLNNNVKRYLKDLTKEGVIFETIKGRYSANKSNTIIFNPKVNSIKFIKELDSEQTKDSLNTKKIILTLLQTNYDFNFSPKDISTYIARIILEENNSSKVIQQFKENEEQQDYSENEIIVEKDFISNISAIESMNELIKIQRSSKAVEQTEMALLAYLYKSTSGYYFHEKILTDELMNLEETSCIEKFLNDKGFINFNKLKPIGRTTAHYRKNQGLMAMKNVLSDLSAEAQSIFIKEYSAYLEKRYRYYRGEVK